MTPKTTPWCRDENELWPPPLGQTGPSLCSRGLAAAPRAKLPVQESQHWFSTEQAQPRSKADCKRKATEFGHVTAYLPSLLILGKTPTDPFPLFPPQEGTVTSLCQNLLSIPIHL